MQRHSAVVPTINTNSQQLAHYLSQEENAVPLDEPRLPAIVDENRLDHATTALTSVNLAKDEREEILAFRKNCKRVMRIPQAFPPEARQQVLSRLRQVITALHSFSQFTAARLAVDHLQTVYNQLWIVFQDTLWYPPLKYNKDVYAALSTRVYIIEQFLRHNGYLSEGLARTDSYKMGHIATEAKKHFTSVNGVRNLKKNFALPQAGDADLFKLTKSINSPSRFFSCGIGCLSGNYLDFADYPHRSQTSIVHAFVAMEIARLCDHENKGSKLPATSSNVYDPLFRAECVYMIKYHFQPLQAHPTVADHQMLAAIADEPQSVLGYTPGSNLHVTEAVARAFGSKNLWKLSLFGAHTDTTPESECVARIEIRSPKSPFYQNKLVDLRAKYPLSQMPSVAALHNAALFGFDCTRFQRISDAKHQAWMAEFEQEYGVLQPYDFSFQVRYEVAIPLGVGYFPNNGGPPAQHWVGHWPSWVYVNHTQPPVLPPSGFVEYRQ